MPGRLKEPQKLASAIRDAVNLTDGIDAIYTKAGLEKPAWRKSGAGEWKIVCPFHNDHDPSLDVNDSKGLYRCRAASCQRVKSDGTPTAQAGDLITFAREFMHWTFMEAARFFCELSGLNIEEYLAEPTEEEKAQDADRAKLETMISLCEKLTEWPGKRISAEVLERFEIRRCPGHIRVSQEGRIQGWDQQPEDDFVILPTRGDDGELVGWVTRRLESSHEARQNPSRWICADSSALYGLFQVRPLLHQYGHKIIAVEGQTDALAMWSENITNTVALRGANLQEPHWRQIVRWNIREVTLCLDGDDAGRTGTHTAAANFWNAGPVLSIATLPEGEDPDSMLRGGDPLPLFYRLTRGPGEDRLLDAPEYLLRGEERHHDLTTLSGRRAFIDRAMADLKMAHADGYRKKLIVGWLSERFNMPTLQIMDLFTEEASPLSTMSAEQAVLARLMSESDWAASMFARLSEVDFQYARHQILFRLIRNANGAGIDCTDRETFSEYARRHGYAHEITSNEFLDEVMGYYKPNDDWWVDYMIDGSFRRQTIQEASILRAALADANQSAPQAAAEFTAKIMSLTMWAEGGTQSKTKEEQVLETMDTIDERMANPDQIIGHDLGPCFPQLNMTLRGMQQGRLHVIAAGQSVGKTTFQNNLAAHWAVHLNIPTLFIGLEMNYVEYHTRLLGQICGMDASQIDSGRLNDVQRARVARGGAKLADAPLWFETPDSMNMDELLMICRAHKISHGIKAVFLDYTQLIEPTRDQRRLSRYEMMGEVAKTMKLKIARGMDVAFIAAAQMNRESAKNGKSTAEGVGDSYMISQTADTFMILSENEGNPNVIDLYLDKNRQGRKDILFPLGFDGPTQTMWEYSNGSKVPPYRVQ